VEEIVARALQPSEIEALDKSGGLLRFAAENNRLPEETVSTICTAWDVAEAKQWDQSIATRFWLAFNSLCTLIKPVTMDSLSTNLREIARPRWMISANLGEPTTLPSRTARRYLLLLFGLLLAAVVLSFIVTTGNNLASDLRKLIGEGNQLTDKINSQIDLLGLAIAEKEFAAAPDRQKEVSVLQSQLQEQNFLLDQMLQKTKIMSGLISFGFDLPSYELGTLKPASDLNEAREAVRSYLDTRRIITSYLLKESFAVGIISTAVLPIVLGLMGACAYVIRLISDQIKDTTFSTTSRIRHVVRVALGGLAGVVIGFGGVAEAGTISPSALAFLAGYAVEPVFATFDSIAEKFRR
jgi:hypothetical protein